MRTVPPFAASRALALLAAVSLSACATKGDLRDLEDEIQALGRDNQALIEELQRQQRLTVDTLRTQSDQLVDFQGTVLSQLRQIEDLLDRVFELTGQNSNAVSSMRDELANMRRTVVQPPPQTAEEGGGADASRDPNEVVEAYNAGVRFRNRGSLPPARLAFERVVNEFPSDTLAAYAQYWLADILVEEDRIEEAIGAFEQVRARWPTSHQVPESLYRIGVLHLEDDRDEARRVFRLLVNTYPESDAATQGRQRLRDLGGRLLR